MSEPENRIEDLEDQQTIRGLRPGDRVLGRFVLENCVGRGGMGEVWAAQDETLKERIALKLLPRMIHFDSQAVEDLKNETKRGRQLSHPSVVRVFDFYQDDENSAIAMEYVSGDNLSSLLSREPNRVFTVEAISDWVIELLQGLEYAHEVAEVVHRDLKPANLLVESETQLLKIADFGIARCVAESMERVTVSAHNRGTLCYMSPEQIAGRGVNRLDDIYALGATIYELLAGTPPFYTGDVFNQVLKIPPTPIVERQRERGFDQPPPKNWDDAIMQCLSKERSQRPSGAGELLEMLELGSAKYAKAKKKTPHGSPARRSSEEGDSSSLTGDLTASIRATSPLTVETSAVMQSLETSVERASFDLTSSDGVINTDTALPTLPVGRRSQRKTGMIASIVGGAALVITLCGTVYYQMNNSWRGRETGGGDVAIGTSGTRTPDTQTDVSPKGGGKLNGEWNVPGDFLTIREAIAAASNGDTILVGAGEFNERLILKEGITLRGAGLSETIVKTDGRGGAAVSATRVKDVKLEAIGFFHDGGQVFASGHSVGEFIQCEGLIVSSCAFRSGIRHGLYLSGKGDASVIDCRLEDNTESGMWTDAGAKFVMEAGSATRNMAGVTLRDDGTTGAVKASEFFQNLTHGMEVSDQAFVSVGGNCKFSENEHCGILAVDHGTRAAVEKTEFVKNRTGAAIRDGASGDLREIDFRGNELGMEFADAGESSLLDSIVQDCVLEGIACDAEKISAPILIKNNEVARCAKFGLVVIGRKSSPSLVGNRFGPNGHGDAIVSMAATASFMNNVFLSKKGVIVEPPAKAIIDESNQHLPEA